MGRKAKPTAIIELQGTGNSTRMKEREDEPVAPGDVPLDPPDVFHMNDRQKEAWRYAVVNAPRNVLGAIDVGTLAIYIIAQDRLGEANRMQQQLDADNALPLLLSPQRKNGDPYQSPYVSIMNTASERMLKAAAELGFTPASRPRLAGRSGADVYLPRREAIANTGEEVETQADLENFLSSSPDRPDGPLN